MSSDPPTKAQLQHELETLRTSFRRLQRLTAASHEALLLYSDGRVVDANAEALSILDMTIEAVIAKPLVSLIVPQCADRIRAHLTPGQNTDRFEVELISSGAVVAATGQTYLFDPDDTNTVSVLAFRPHDRTVLNMTAERDGLSSTQERTMNAVGRLAGGVAHDMNNVLGAVMGLASVVEDELRSRPEMGEITRDLQEIISVCRHGRDLTRDLLGFARRGKLLRHQMRINRLLGKIRIALKRDLARRVDIRVEGDPDLFMIEGDPAQIHHAFMNVCQNAIEAMPDGGQLTLRTRSLESVGPPDGPWVQVEISDEGHGMSSEALEHAFEPFFTTKASGRGLGLSMVYGTIVNHGGQVWLSSSPGQGTKVTITLPALKQRERQSTPNSSDAVAHVQHSGTVLLVDDEPLIRRATGRMLRRLGYHVLLAENGEEALEVYDDADRMIDMVVLDLVMPVMNGEQAFAALREREPSLRIVLCSGHTSQAAAHRLELAGANGFLRKPFDLNRLSLVLKLAQV